MTFPDTRVDGEIHRAWQNLANGLPPAKTVTSLPRALNAQVDRTGQEGRLLYMYDPAGEAFGETEGLQLHKYQDYLSGLVFLIDPFSIPEVREIYADRLPQVANALKPSQSPGRGRLRANPDRDGGHFGLEKGARIKKPVAVVINKIDAFGLEQRIGEPAVQARLRSTPAPADAEAIRNQIVREQLVRWGLSDLVHQLEIRCSLVRYFACTSLGRMPDGAARLLEGRGVLLEPLLWILESPPTRCSRQRTNRLREPCRRRRRNYSFLHYVGHRATRAQAETRTVPCPGTDAFPGGPGSSPGQASGKARRTCCRSPCPLAIQCADWNRFLRFALRALNLGRMSRSLARPETLGVLVASGWPQLAIDVAAKQARGRRPDSGHVRHRRPLEEERSAARF